MANYRSIAAIKAANRAAGHFFFSADTMKFFKSKVYPTVYGGRYFVTSEQPPHGDREYQVRWADDRGHIQAGLTFPSLGEAKAEARAQSRERNPASGEADSSAAHELASSAQWQARPRHGQKEWLDTFWKNATIKKAQGKYNSALAVKLFGYAIDQVLPVYGITKADLNSDGWSYQKTRTEAAEELRDVFERRFAAGDFDHFIPKKYQKKKNPSFGYDRPLSAFQDDEKYRQGKRVGTLARRSDKWSMAQAALADNWATWGKGGRIPTAFRKGFMDGWRLGGQGPAGRLPNPKDSITLRGRPANILADMSLAEVRRRNPELAADIDRAGGVSVVSVDAGGGAEPAMLAMDGSIVPLDELDNTAVLEPAFAVSEEFHGRAPRYAQGVHETLDYSPVLTDLGRLVELGIYSQTSKGKPAETPLQFGAREGIQLATNPEKNQLFIVGAVSLDQRTLARLGVDASEFDKEKIAIGPVLNIVYHTRKKLHHFKATDYIHQLGEDDGTMPVLIYDRLNDQLELAGGTYTISERGIIN
jgi:hypothetical protein